MQNRGLLKLLQRYWGPGVISPQKPGEIPHVSTTNSQISYNLRPRHQKNLRRLKYPPVN